MASYLWLITGGVLNILIGLAHLVAIYVGAEAYAFMDAPDLARLASEGSVIPALVTGMVILFFFLFAAYGFSGAGLMKRLPFLKKGCVLIGILYVCRGLAVLWFLYLYVIASPLSYPWEILFSLIALVTGICYLKGITGKGFSVIE